LIRIHGAQVGKHDPVVLCVKLGLGVKPFVIGVKPLNLYGLFGDIDVDGSRDLLLATAAHEYNSLLFGITRGEQNQLPFHKDCPILAPLLSRHSVEAQRLQRSAAK
jgi:hypothetical protein